MNSNNAARRGGLRHGDLLEAGHAVELHGDVVDAGPDLVDINRK